MRINYPHRKGDFPELPSYYYIQDRKRQEVLFLRDNVNNLHTETWKPINDERIVPHYEISNYGNIRNHKSGKYIKQRYNRSGYMFVGLTGNNKRIFFETHRAVMLAFNPIDDAYYYQVNHISHIKNDNRLDNLEWVSQGENLAKKYEVVNINKVEFVLKQYLDETTIKEISKKLRG